MAIVEKSNSMYDDSTNNVNEQSKTSSSFKAASHEKTAGDVFNTIVPSEGVQVNYSMINPPDLVVDNYAFPEPQVLSYRNADKCRETMLKVFEKHFRNMKQQIMSEEE